MIKRFLILFLLSGTVQNLFAKKVAIFCADSEQAYGDSKEDFKILGKSIKEAGFELVSDYPKKDGVLDKIVQGFGPGQVDYAEVEQQKKRGRDDFEAPVHKNDAITSFIDRYKECDFIICFFTGEISNMFTLNNCCLSFLSEENMGKLIIFNLT